MLPIVKRVCCLLFIGSSAAWLRFWNRNRILPAHAIARPKAVSDLLADKIMLLIQKLEGTLVPLPASTILVLLTTKVSLLINFA